MRFLFFLLFLAMLAYAGYPYVNLYRLDRALMQNDRAALNALVDVGALRAQHKAMFEKQVRRSIGEQPGPISDLVRDGARWYGVQTADTIDLDWVRQRLRRERASAPDAYPSIITDTTFAFFERPTRFLIRLGDLGDNPIHVRMGLEDWRWRVTGIYD